MEETKIVDNGEVIDADALMAEFDRESNVRHFTGKKKIVIRTLMIAFALYAIITSIFGKYLLLLDNKIITGLMTWPGSSTGFLGLVLVITFLIFPAYKAQAKKINYIPWYDYILAAAGFASFFYIVVEYQNIVNRAININTLDVIFAIIELGYFALTRNRLKIMKVFLRTVVGQARHTDIAFL